MTAIRKRRQSGQAMMEWGFIFPLFLFTCFAILEIGLMLFVIGTAEFQAGEAARALATQGNVDTADTVVLAQIRASFLGGGSFGNVTRVEISRVDQFGNIQLDANGKPQTDRYVRVTPGCSPNLPDWCAQNVDWPPASRHVGLGCTDSFRVTIFYEYGPRTQLLGQSTALSFEALRAAELEPSQPSSQCR